MKKFYLLPLLLFYAIASIAQPCSALDFTYTTAESRCVSTGSITVNVSGGSGNYNYKATGPIITPFTSSNIITGLAPGYYNILVQDMTTGCIKQIDSARVIGDYDDPRFQLTKTDASCSGNDGTVSVINQQFGRSPFTYSIIAPSPSNVGASSSSGNFTGLIPGEYVIQLQDSCGGIQVRRITIENYSWWFDSVSVTKIGCDSLAVYIRVRDNKGNVNTIGTAFNGFSYGFEIAGDTTWFSSYDFHLFSGKARSLNILTKDNCGNIHSTIWNAPPSDMPSLGAVSLSNLACSTFTASLGGNNLTNPQYCLYDNNSVLIECNFTGVFNNVIYGSYCIEMTNECYDTLITRCFTAGRPLPAVGANVNISNQNCTGFTATISGQQNLYNPQYCLLDANNIVVACNSTGIFNDVPFGTYCIETHDECTDSLIRRCFTVVKPVPVLTSTSISNAMCDSFRVTTGGTGLLDPTYCLYDSLGNVVTCNSTGIFTVNGYGSYCIRAVSCGDTSNTICFTASKQMPSVGASVVISNKQCSTFTASITGQYHLISPQYCLYDALDSLVTCNSSGVFNNIPYGSYCIKVNDGCVDTTITRCFTVAQPRPSINGNIQVLSSTCNTVSIKVNGSNLTSPTYCLYDAANVLVTCNFSGTFNNIPFGQYCVEVTDGCVDTVIQVCQTFTPVSGINLTTSKACTLGNANVSVAFDNNNSPFNVKIYHPNGTLLVDTTTNSDPFSIQMPYLPSGAQYKIVGTDGCGNVDSATIAPDANILTKSVQSRAKCPSATWLNGAGDLIVSSSSNHYSVIPSIIKKDGAAFVRSFSSVSASVYTFADLEPATYILEYLQSTCNSRVYDTVTIPPYAYPTQGQSAIYQCDNNSFSMGAAVQGGVSPYTFQIIGSIPSSPDITTAPQASPVFNINTGTTYSLVRLRTVDACGNATLSDVSVLPLQNITIAADNTCFFQNITLTVDTVPNATYTWYRKTTPVDSTLLGTGTAYNLPFFVPEQVGDYICKVVINEGCIVRLLHFNLDGNCGQIFLPGNLTLMGKKDGSNNKLHWNNNDERGILKYIVERKANNESKYAELGTVAVRQGRGYVFNDSKPVNGMNHYRLKLVYANKIEYSNVVGLNASAQKITVYPNPAKNKVNISISGEIASQYRIDILSSSGEMVYSTELKNTTSAAITYTRKNSLPSGMYLVRIKNMTANTTEIRKLLFE